MICCDVEGVARAGVQPEDVLNPVRLGGDDSGHTGGVVDLSTDRVFLDERADRDQPGRRADERIVGLARRDLLGGVRPDVEPDGRVEAEDLVDQRVLEFVIEDLRVLRGREVAVLDAGGHVRSDDSVDELLEAPLTLWCADRAAEVLGRHDVGRVDGPEIGELHPVLLEVDRAVTPVGHDDVAALPGDLVVGMDSLAGVDALDGEPLGRLPATTRRGTARRLGHVVPLPGTAWAPCGPRAWAIPMIYSPLGQGAGTWAPSRPAPLWAARSAVISSSKSVSDSKPRYTEAKRR